jgi:hypothetical protein
VTSISSIVATDVVTVTVSGDAKAGWKIEVKPKVSFVMLGGSLAFEVAGLPKGYTLEIDYRAEGDKKGPFRKRGNDPRGRLTFAAPDRIVLYYDDSVDTAVWKYDVALRDEKGDDKAVIDPMTVGKGTN